MSKSRVRLEGRGENSRVNDTYDIERKQMDDKQINSSLEDVGVKSAKRAGTKGATVIGNTTRAKTVKNILSEIISDQGGLDNMSYVQMELARRYASLAMIAQNYDQNVVLDDITQKDLDNLIIITRTLAQISKNIGTERKSKDINGSNLHDYLKQIDKQSKKADKKADAIEDADYYDD